MKRTALFVSCMCFVGMLCGAAGLKSRYTWDRYWTNRDIPHRSSYCRDPAAPGCDGKLTTMELAVSVAELLREHDCRIASAESITAGKFAAALIETPGAGDIYAFGFVTLATESKQAFLNVTADTNLTVVSAETAREMVLGLQEKSKEIEGDGQRPVNVLISFTGVATTWLDFRPQVFIGIKVKDGPIEVLPVPLRDDLTGDPVERTTNMELAVRAGLEVVRERLIKAE